ncbi:MAG: Gfo/Idh/MocA family protein [Planctomycetota bacterium]
MSTRPIRLGIVGDGRIAKDYRRALAGLDDFELVAVCDQDPLAQGPEPSGHELQFFSRVEPMLLETDLDAALVLTPPASHAGISSELLRAGCHVFCEKPLATSSAAARSMYKRAQQTGRLLMMATKFRFIEDVIAARELLQQDLLGELVFFENSFCSVVDMASRWNSDPRNSGGGVLIDNGSHSADLARFLVGPLIRVFAHYGRRTQKIQVEDSVRIQIEARGGLLGQVDLSWSLDKASDVYFSLHGAKGSMQLGWQGSRYRLHGTDWTSFGSGYDKIKAFTAQLDHFARVIRGEEEPQVACKDALESVRFIEAAYASAGHGRWVPISDEALVQ